MHYQPVKAELARITFQSAEELVEHEKNGGGGRTVSGMLAAMGNATARR